MTDHAARYLSEITSRLERVASNRRSLDEAVDLISDAITQGGIVQAFGTGHSEAFAMEIAGRAGGLIPTNRIPLRDVALRGSRDLAVLRSPLLERDPSVVDELLAVSTVEPEDIFVIASNSGVNGSIVGMALTVKERGHKVIAVTSLAHTTALAPTHPSGRRLCEVADVVIDNLAPFGDTAVTTPAGIGIGAISSVTSGFIAQLITIGVTDRLAAAGDAPPVYLSDNVPGGSEHNRRFETLYNGRIRREA